MITKELSAAGQSYYTVADHISVWVAGSGAIHMKTNDPHGDPVELSESEAISLIELLNELVNQVR